MSDVQFNINVNTGSSTASVGGVKNAIDDTAVSTDKLYSKLKNIGDAAFVFNNIKSALNDIGNDFNKAIEPGISFNQGQKELQAITGVTNDKLKEITGNTREMAKAFGVDAANALEANKLLLSQLGPELADTPAALKLMAEDSAILSKQMGGDTAAATEVLTTAMNQFGVSIEDPLQATRQMTDMMNVMSAAAKEGSAELPQIKSALEQSGMMAHTAHVSFNELNAAIQVLDKSGKKGAEGGTALRNIMARLSEGQFLPKHTLEMLEAAGINVDKMADKSLTLAQRVAQLKPIMNDTGRMTMLFGTENVAAGIALVNNTENITSLTEKIGGTNTATEMATTIMGSFSERMARVNAWLKDVGISIFNVTEGFIPFLKIGGGALQMMSNFAGAVQAWSIIADTKFGGAISGAIAKVGIFTSSLWAGTAALMRNALAFAGTALTAIGSWIVGLVSATAAQIGLNVAMTANPIGLIIVGIAACVAAIVGLIAYWDEIKEAIAKFGKWLWDHNPFKIIIDLVDKVFPGFKQAMSDLWDWIKDKFDMLFGWIGDAWDWVKGLFGGDDGEGGVADMAAAGAVNKSMTAEEKKKAIENLPHMPGYQLMGDQMYVDAKGLKFGTAVDLPAGAVPAPDLKLGGATSSGGGGKHTKLAHTKAAKEASSNISSGGQRPLQINMTIGKLQDQTVIHTTNLQMGGQQAGDEIVAMLLEAVSSANRAIQNNN